MSVQLDRDIVVTIRRTTEEPECDVCVGKDPQQCDPQYQRLTYSPNTTVEFTCPKPEEIFDTDINREIVCTETVCSGNSVQTKDMFSNFNRTFTWDLKVESSQTFQLDFPKPGMRQIPEEETCPDDHTYSVVAYLRSGPTSIGTFCKGGPVTTVQEEKECACHSFYPKLVVSLYFSCCAKTLDPFSVITITSSFMFPVVAIAIVDLPRGVSDTVLFSANYLKRFPNEQQMQWSFNVPGMHNYSVSFLDHTNPECIQDNVVVEYQKENGKSVQLSLTDPQPQHQQGNFQMVLKNCQTNTSLPGLTLSYKVSVMRSGHPGRITHHFNRNLFPSGQNDLNLGWTGTKASLSFLDCPNEDVRLTGMKSCPSAALSVPNLDLSLPMPLHSFTWNFTIPNNSTLDLVAPVGNLKQSLPGQECSRASSFHLAEYDGFPIGDFCFGGTIQKIQVHTNASITTPGRDFKRSTMALLNVSFLPMVEKGLIYTIIPEVSSPTTLVSPNWPNGMKKLSTISWNVHVPDQYKALLKFVNVSQPKCSKVHAIISVQMMGREEEVLSRTETEKMEKQLLVSHPFYLNMINCKPETGSLSLLTEVVLEKKLLNTVLSFPSVALLAIVLGLVGALVVLGIVKKKKKLNKENSAYVTKGNIFRPSDRHFTKTRSENESHVYASIDEFLVYGHLLDSTPYSDSLPSDKMQVDSYQTFTGTTDGALPVINEPDPEPETGQYKAFLAPSETFIPSRPHTPIQAQDSLDYQDRRMVDNELYTFKNTGDINTIRLSAVEPDTSMSDDYL
uniref:CUB domain containing protein 1a n=1 Tax=Oryzias melastigma TaxID=30732 RepID=A0A3B3BPL9_ORYME